MRAFTGLLLLLAIAACAPLPGETLAFPRQAGGTTVALQGRLWLPPGNAPVPALILSHGSGGMAADHEPRYAAELNAMGVAVLAIDHFGPRGITSTVSDQSQVSETAMTLDAMAALDALAAHPRIQADRIGIAGFSKGGAVTWRAALRRFNAGRPAGAPRFALHVAFYPHCGFRYLDMRTTGAPLRFLVGERDTYTGAPNCVILAEEMKAAGDDAETVVYPGAQHGFDTFGRDYYVASGENSVRCFWQELPGRRWRETTGGGEFRENDLAGARAARARCLRHGVSGGPDPAARAASMARLKQEITLHLLGQR